MGTVPSPQRIAGLRLENPVVRSEVILSADPPPTLHKSLPKGFILVGSWAIQHYTRKKSLVVISGSVTSFDIIGN